MDSKKIFTSKAEKYNQYRWDYAPEALACISQETGLTPASIVADVGAGTGILTRHFIGKVRHVYAVEPNDKMRALLEKNLAALSGWTCLSSSAENTTLPGHSIHLITAGTAIGWFNPELARKEFLRILKPGGWLAILHNRNTHPLWSEMLQDIFSPENGASPHAARKLNHQQPIQFFYGEKLVAERSFPFSFVQRCETFIGALTSASNAPNQDHPLYANFEAAARKVFDQNSRDGRLEVRGATELYLDHILANQGGSQ